MVSVGCALPTAVATDIGAAAVLPSTVIGAVQGYTASKITGGSAWNGIFSGVINGAVSSTLNEVKLPGKAFISQFAGGFSGSLSSDIFDYMDGSKRSFTDVLGRAVTSGFSQAILCGPATALGNSNFAGLVFGYGATLTSIITNAMWDTHSQAMDLCEG